MSGAVHTPGPWVWDGCSLSDFGREFPCSMSMEWVPNGRFADCDGERVNENVEDDARLIAAAPELLEGGADLLASLDPDTLNPEQFNAWCALNAAIAKARGAA